MSICNVSCFAIDLRTRCDNDIYYKVVENNGTYCILKSLKSGVKRRIQTNDKYLKFISSVEVVEENNIYDFNGLGENGIILYNDPNTLYNWRQSGNVASFNINNLSISSFGGSEALYNTPYIEGELNRGLGHYYSSAQGKFHTITADFMVPDETTEVTITFETYNAWNRFPDSTPRWAGLKYYIDGNTSDDGQCTVTSEGDSSGLLWFTPDTSPSTCIVSKTYSVTPGQHSLSIFFGILSGMTITPPSGYDNTQYRNVNMAIDNIKLEFA